MGYGMWNLPYLEKPTHFILCCCYICYILYISFLPRRTALQTCVKKEERRKKKYNPPLHPIISYPITFMVVAFQYCLHVCQKDRPWGSMVIFENHGVVALMSSVQYSHVATFVLFFVRYHRFLLVPGKSSLSLLTHRLTYSF